MHCLLLVIESRFTLLLLVNNLYHLNIFSLLFLITPRVYVGLCDFNATTYLLTAKTLIRNDMNEDLHKKKSVCTFANY